MTPSVTESERQIAHLVDVWTQALRAKDVNGRTDHYADDVVVFDVITPTQHVGRKAVTRRLADWFSTFRGPIECEVLEQHISADERIAFCHSLQRFQGDLANGGRLNMVVRYTTCFRSTADGWTVTHEHASTPFDPATGLASITPEGG